MPDGVELDVVVHLVPGPDRLCGGVRLGLGREVPQDDLLHGRNPPAVAAWPASWRVVASSMAAGGLGSSSAVGDASGRCRRGDGAPARRGAGLARPRTRPALCSPGHAPPHRPALGHRHAPHRGHAPRDGGGPRRGRRLRRRPHVNELEARAADLLGKEAGLFVASGTMGNLVSLMAHLPRGHEAIAGETTHTVMDEAGGHAVVVGATIRALRERADGTMDPAEIEGAFRDPDDLHEPITGLVVIENTHAHSGGRPLPMDYVARVSRHRPRARRPAAHGRRPVLQRGGGPGHRARRAGGASPTPSRSACRRASRAPIGSVVVGPAAVHRPRPPRPQAPGRRHAPGRRPRGGRPRRAVGRPRRHDRPPRRGPRQRAPPGGGPRGAPGRPLARRHRPAGRRRPARSRPAPSPTSSCSVSSATAPRSSPPWSGGACCWSPTPTARSAPSRTSG